MAIKIGGTTVIDNSANITTSVGGFKTVGGVAITGSGNIDAGGGDIGFNSSSTTQSSTFTKPNNGYNVKENFFSNNYNSEVSGTPSSSYEIVVGGAAANSTIAMLSFSISGASTHNRRGSYFGDVLIAGKKNTVTNKSAMYANMASGWTTQTVFPVSFTSGLIILDQNDRLVIWGSDVYTGGGQFNSNLVISSGAATMTIKELTIT